MNKYYVIADGSIETAEKIKKFFSELGIDAAEISKFEFLNIISNIYYVDKRGSIQASITTPEGYMEINLNVV